MRNIDASTITPAFLLRIAACPDARLKQILGSLVTHPYLDSDVVFGVRSSLIGRCVHHECGTAPDGTAMRAPYETLEHDFVLAPTA